MTERNAGIPQDHRMLFRVGVNLADVIIDGDDIHGNGVNVAARLQEIAEPGGIAISGNVREQIRDKLELSFADDGMHEVKNIVQPVHVWRWSLGQSSAPSPSDGAYPAPSDKPSIVVLPFDNMSGDQEREYFADGLTEDIITELSRFQSFSSSRGTRLLSTRVNR
jgi:adenylate cyclase